MSNFWNNLDLAGAQFTKVFFRMVWQSVIVCLFGAVVYLIISSIPERYTSAFTVLFFVFLLLYLILAIFAITVLITKFQKRKTLPPRGDGAELNPNAGKFYRALWRVETILGINEFRLRDRYRYWSFIHYLIAIVMFLNATYCLARTDSLLEPQSQFVKIAAIENVKYTADLIHKGIVISEGLARKLKREYRDVTFLGYRFGTELAQIYASSDVFVFPSKTDTFGVVQLEALASGLPIAAFPVPGPSDIIGEAPVGVMDVDLRSAALEALDLRRDRCRVHAERFPEIGNIEAFFDVLKMCKNSDSRIY